MAMQSEITKKYLFDFDKVLPKLLTYYTKLFGYNYREQIQQALNSTTIFVYAQNDMWIEFLKTAHKKGYNAKMRGELKKGIDYVVSLSQDNQPLVNECIEGIAIKIDESQEHIKDIINKMINAKTNGAYVSGTDKDYNFNGSVLFVMSKERLFGDLLIFHEFLHAISCKIKTIEGQRYQYEGFIYPRKLYKKDETPLEPTKMDMLCSDLNETATQYFANKLFKEHIGKKQSFINVEDDCSGYNNALLVMNYMYEKLEPQMKELYINADYEGLIKFFGQQNFEKILDINTYFLRQCDINLFVPVVSFFAKKPVSAGDIIKNTSILPQMGEEGYHPAFDKIREIKAITESLSKKVQTKNND